MSQSIIYIISILKNEMKWCGCKSGLNLNVWAWRELSRQAADVEAGCCTPELSSST